MNLQPLFETQEMLDQRIKEQKGLKDADLLDKKVLALQVELGECANEWRGFKFWSKDQEPRTKVVCPICRGEGFRDFVEPFSNEHFTEDCESCEGCGVLKENPLLEEYVDCLHFILGIGLEIKVVNLAVVEPFRAKSGLVQQFNVLFKHVGELKMQLEADWNAGHRKYAHIVSLFVGLGEMLGFSCDQIEQAYYDKNKINHERQANGY